jgi:pimeloyl-ACP methyl ester carboxylesterase
MAKDVVSVLDSAEIRTVHVIGTSLGGMVAQELAISHPHRVDRLVLACTTPGWPFAYPMPTPSVRLMAEQRSLPREVALRRHVENALAAGTVERRPELVDRIVSHQLAHLGDPDAWAAQACAGAHYFGHLRQARIRAQTLVMHGDADTVVDPRNGMLLAARIPHAQLMILPDRGHLFFWEDPNGFLQAVLPFLLADTGSAHDRVAPTPTPAPVTVDRAARPIDLERPARPAPPKRASRRPKSGRASRPTLPKRAARLAGVRRAWRQARIGLTRVMKR